MPDDNANVLTLAPGKTDHDRAAELKAQMIEAVKPMLVLLDLAISDGFQVSFSLGPVPPLNKQGVQSLIISKHF